MEMKAGPIPAALFSRMIERESPHAARARCALLTQVVSGLTLSQQRFLFPAPYRALGAAPPNLSGGERDKPRPAALSGGIWAQDFSLSLQPSPRWATLVGLEGIPSEARPPVLCVWNTSGGLPTIRVRFRAWHLQTRLPSGP